MTTQIHRLQRAKTWLAVGAVLAAFAALAAGFAAGPAQAGGITREWDVGVTDTAGGSDDASGHLIWYNRAVRVGGTLANNPAGPGCARGPFGPRPGICFDRRCAAVVFTAVDRHNKIVARTARPGGTRYLCNSSLGFGFTLKGRGIRRVYVDLWKTHPVHRASRDILDRPTGS